MLVHQHTHKYLVVVCYHKARRLEMNNAVFAASRTDGSVACPLSSKRKKSAQAFVVLSILKFYNHVMEI